MYVDQGGGYGGEGGAGKRLTGRLLLAAVDVERDATRD